MFCDTNKNQEEYLSGFIYLLGAALGFSTVTNTKHDHAFGWSSIYEHCLGNRDIGYRGHYRNVISLRY